MLRPMAVTDGVIGVVVTRCTHGSIFLECSPNFYPVEWPPQNHTQGPNFGTLWPLLANPEFLTFSLMLVTGPRILISAPYSSCWHPLHSGTVVVHRQPRLPRDEPGQL